MYAVVLVLCFNMNVLITFLLLSLFKWKKKEVMQKKPALYSAGMQLTVSPVGLLITVGMSPTRTQDLPYG